MMFHAIFNRSMCIVLLFLLCAFKSSAETINSEVQRTIDLTSPVVKITVDLKVTGIENEYQIAFPDSHAKQLAYLSVSKKGGKSLPTTAPVK